MTKKGKISEIMTLKWDLPEAEELARRRQGPQNSRE